LRDSITFPGKMGAGKEGRREEGKGGKESQAPLKVRITEAEAQPPQYMLQGDRVKKKGGLEAPPIERREGRANEEATVAGREDKGGEASQGRSDGKKGKKTIQEKLGLNSVA